MAFTITRDGARLVAKLTETDGAIEDEEVNLLGYGQGTIQKIRVWLNGIPTTSELFDVWVIPKGKLTGFSIGSFDLASLGWRSFNFGEGQPVNDGDIIRFNFPNTETNIINIEVVIQ